MATTATATTTPRLSIRQVGAYAYQAGFRGLQLIYAVAIAMRESGGRVDAQCDHCIPKPGGGYYNDYSFGLWQINLLAHPQYSREKLVTDPAYAARAAWEVSGHGTTFKPWQTPAGNFLASTNVPLVTKELGPLLAGDELAVKSILNGAPAYSTGGLNVAGSAANITGIGLPGIPNPFDWGGNNIAKWVIKPILDLLHVDDLIDLTERGALVFFGTIIFMLGIAMMVSNSTAGEVVSDTTDKAKTAAKAAAMA